MNFMFKFMYIFLNYIIKISIIAIFQITKRKLYQLNSCNFKRIFENKKYVKR